MVVKDARGVVIEDARAGDSVRMAAGTSCTACVVVLSAGAYASTSMTFGLKGQMPVFRNTLLIVVAVNALSRARE